MLQMEQIFNTWKIIWLMQSCYGMWEGMHLSWQFSPCLLIGFLSFIWAFLNVFSNLYSIESISNAWKQICSGRLCGCCTKKWKVRRGTDWTVHILSSVTSLLLHTFHLWQITVILLSFYFFFWWKQNSNPSPLIITWVIRNTQYNGRVLQENWGCLWNLNYECISSQQWMCRLSNSSVGRANVLCLNFYFQHRSNVKDKVLRLKWHCTGLKGLRMNLY